LTEVRCFSPVRVERAVRAQRPTRENNGRLFTTVPPKNVRANTLGRRPTQGCANGNSSEPPRVIKSQPRNDTCYGTDDCTNGQPPHSLPCRWRIVLWRD